MRMEIIDNSLGRSVRDRLLGNLAAVGIFAGLGELLFELFANGLVDKVLDPMGRFVNVVDRQAEFLNQVGFPQAMGPHQLAGLLLALVGKRESRRLPVD